MDAVEGLASNPGRSGPKRGLGDRIRVVEGGSAYSSARQVDTLKSGDNLKLSCGLLDR